MAKVPKIYLETSVFKNSATRLLRLQPKKALLDWGHIQTEVVQHDLVYVNPIARHPDSGLREEARSLERIAELATADKIKLVTNMETIFESWNLPKMDSATGMFYGAPIEMITAPVKYSRIIGSGMPEDFLPGLAHPRFKALQKLTGAYQGEGRYNKNQLCDAFQLWCAEHHNCDFFLTFDFKLIGMVERDTKCFFRTKLIKPRQLLEMLESPAKTECHQVSSN